MVSKRGFFFFHYSVILSHSICKQVTAAASAKSLQDQSCGGPALLQALQK